MDDWQRRARREAAAILDESGIYSFTISHELLVSVVAVAWLQGVNLGAHTTLSAVEESFEQMRAGL